ncbi:MAG: type II secretion system GspH family protein [Lentisphaeraceae bacterium]|nr:type II secretion system GspH family protein [Lentisphaeraceae bacterium]
MKKFTLLELMVVVAIIGILMTLLMPSLSKAREKGRIALCLSNQKQLTILNFTFSSDNDNRAVGSGVYLMGANGSVEYPNIFNWLYYNKENMINRLGAPEEGEIGCPSSQNIHKWSRAFMYNIDLRGGPWWSSNAPTKYGRVVTDQNEWPGPAYNSNAEYKLGSKMMKVMTPSDFIMFVDSESSSDVLNSGFHSSSAFSGSLSFSSNGTKIYNRIAFRHEDKSTTAFSDGHVKLTTPVYENYKKSKIYFDHQ